MAAIDTTRALTIGAPARIVNFVGDILNTFEAWRDRRSTANALSQLSDHELADIGLSRGDIDALTQ